MELEGTWIEEGPNHRREFHFDAGGSFARKGTSHWKELDMTTEEDTKGSFSLAEEKKEHMLTLGLGKGKMEVYVAKEGKTKVKGKSVDCIGLFNHNAYDTLVTPQHKLVFEMDEDHVKARIKDSRGNVTLEGIALTKA
jgi:hypothetical protein